MQPFQVLLDSTGSGLSRPSKAQAEQVRSVSVERVGAVVGRLQPDELDDLDSALALHLGL